jgi:hypothetical protein
MLAGKGERASHSPSVFAAIVPFAATARPRLPLDPAAMQAGSWARVYALSSLGN